MKINETLKLKAEGGEYDITVGEDLLSSLSRFMSLSRKVLIVTDSGVPIKYAKTVAAQCPEARIHIFKEGEENKNITTLEGILLEMLNFGMKRSDAVIAVGGGVVGDIAGFAAATYMRGIDFYNIPTTLLSQVDSSVGGKTAIDFHGAKNIVGAFHQPKAVLIDKTVLSTLPERQFSSGMAEIIKMSLTSDRALFEKIENGSLDDELSDIIISALKIKRRVVEADEREGGLRKILNFGHTFGHGIEALGGRYHGECVALGMLPMSSERVRSRLIPVLRKCSLPYKFDFDVTAALEFMKHDKKGHGDSVDAIFVDEIGEYRIERIEYTALSKLINNEINKL